MRGRKRKRLEKGWLARKARNWERRQGIKRGPFSTPNYPSASGEPRGPRFEIADLEAIVELAASSSPLIRPWKSATGDQLYFIPIHPVIAQVLRRPSKWPVKERAARRHAARLRIRRAS